MVLVIPCKRENEFDICVQGKLILLILGDRDVKSLEHAVPLNSQLNFLFRVCA